MEAPKLWLSVKEAAPILDRTDKAIYEQIRTGGFPFEYKQTRKGAPIYISARDIGLIPPETGKEGDESEAPTSNQ